MAKPNLVNATSIYAKSMVHTGTATSITVLSCPSNKAYRITSFAVTGTASTTIADTFAMSPPPDA